MSLLPERKILLEHFSTLNKKRKNMRLMFDPEPVKRDYCRDNPSSVSFRTDPHSMTKKQAVI
jgi:hypothetical protein